MLLFDGFNSHIIDITKKNAKKYAYRASFTCYPVMCVCGYMHKLKRSSSTNMELERGFVHMWSTHPLCVRLVFCEAILRAFS